MFGAVFPCVCLEAKVLDGLGNDVFGGAGSRADSTAAAAVLGARPQGSSESSSGAKPGEEKAPEPPGCSAGQQPLVYLLNKFKNSFVLVHI